MTKTMDFVVSSLFSGGIGYLIGYVWFLLTDINTFNAILMLAGLTVTALALLTATAGIAVWTVRHVRLTIV